MYEKIHLSDVVPVIENKVRAVFLKEKSVMRLFDSQLDQKIITRVVTWEQQLEGQTNWMDHCPGRYLRT